MSSISEQYNNMDPAIKQKLVWIVSGSVLFLFLWMFVSGDENKRKKVTHKVVEDVFTSGDSDKLGTKAMGSQLIELRRAVTKMEQQRQFDKEKATENYRYLNETSTKQIGAIQDTLRKQSQVLKERDREIDVLKSKVSDGVVNNKALMDSLQAMPPTSSSGDDETILDKIELEKTIKNDNSPIIENEWELFSSDDPVTTENGAVIQSGPIMTGYVKYEEEESTENTKEEVIDSFNIPTGSIFSGVLLNGLDAPTNRASKSDPMPVLLRVKHDTILPNRFKMDLKECFILATGFGSLASERILLRSEKLSCQKNNGDVVDIRLDAYAVSSVDGKAGVRGRLVSRNGRLLAMSMLSGFGSGLAQATKPQAIPVINNNGGSNTQFQSSSTSDAFESAAFNGASTALESLADYYMDMAEETFPILELDAGTKVQFIVHVGKIAEVTKAIKPKRG